MTCPICNGGYVENQFMDIASEIVGHHKALAWKIYYALLKAEGAP